MLLEQTFEDLEDDGVELLFAENGRDARSLIEAERLQLVFLDVMMPHLNGMTAKSQNMDKQKSATVGIFVKSSHFVGITSVRNASIPVLSKIQTASKPIAVFLKNVSTRLTPTRPA
jgi:CheY-like chemotaxis protein